MTRWNLTIPDEADRLVRVFLARLGMKKGDLSAFVVDACRREVLRRTLAEVQGHNADLELGGSDAPCGGGRSGHACGSFLTRTSWSPGCSRGRGRRVRSWAAWLDLRFELVTSAEQLDELRRVLAYEKLQPLIGKEQARDFVEDLEKLAD